MDLNLNVENLPGWMALLVADADGEAEAWERVLADEGIQGLLDELSQWETVYLDNHKKSQHLLHKAAFLVDIGMTIKEPRLKNFISYVTKNVDSNGIFRTRIKTYERYGGSGEIEWGWMLCDAPLLTYIAIKSGGISNEQAKPALKYLISLKGEEGWPCKVDAQLGTFRGPGGAKLICPYATLLMLQLLALYPEYHDTEIVHHGVNALLSLWDDQKKRKPFLFAMGTDFKKAKAPLIWYDLLHMLMVLTEFEWVRESKQVHEMAEILKNKMDDQGMIIPESVYMPWKCWEFGQKKEPSFWVSYLANTIMERMT